MRILPNIHFFDHDSLNENLPANPYFHSEVLVRSRTERNERKSGSGWRWVFRRDFVEQIPLIEEGLDLITSPTNPSRVTDHVQKKLVDAGAAERHTGLQLSSSKSRITSSTTKFLRNKAAWWSTKSEKPLNWIDRGKTMHSKVGLFDDFFESSGGHHESEPGSVTFNPDQMKRIKQDTISWRGYWS